MRSYVEDVEWDCGYCGARQEFRYLGQNPQFCSSVCKQRARKVERSLEKLASLEEVRGCKEQRYTALRELARALPPEQAFSNPKKSR